MLYSIIPPIAVVLSLVGIIIFLMKKAPAMARLEEDRVESFIGEKIDNEKREKRMLNGRKMARIISFTIEKFKNIFGSIWMILKKLIVKKREAKNSLIEQKIDENQMSKSEKHRNFFRRRSDRHIEIMDNETYLPSEIEELEAENKELILKNEALAKSSKKDLFEKILIDRIAVNPKDIEAYERLGEYYLEIENWNYAKECFKQVLKLNPRNIGVRSKMRKLERILSN